MPYLSWVQQRLLATLQWLWTWLIGNVAAAVPPRPSTAPSTQRMSQAQRLMLRVLRRAGPVPAHVAFIMDGNRRYARLHRIDKASAHAQGFAKLLEVLEAALELGVRAVTVYAFSIDNFNRPRDEVEALLDLAQHKLIELRTHSTLLTRFGVKVRVLGATAMLPAPLQAAVTQLEQATSSNDAALLYICFPYTSQHELGDAIRRVCADVQMAKIDIHDINETAIDSRLMSAGAPPVDLLVRTSGEKRLSDFLLWQIAPRARLLFEPVLWPDVSIFIFIAIVVRYQLAERLAHR